MKKSIINTIDTNSMYEIHYVNHDGFACGYIIAADDEYVLINSISPEGRFDGLALGRIDDIVTIISCSQYIKKIELLYRANVSEHAKIHITDNLLLDLITYSNSNNIMITVDCDCTKHTGYIKDINDEFIVLELYDQYGRKDGVATIDLSYVEYIDCGSAYEQGIAALKDN